MKILFWVIIIIFTCSCIGSNKEKHFGQKYLGLYIDNGSRQGLTYEDTLGVKYNYRYITTTLTNDTTVPVYIKIAFLKEYNYPCSLSANKFKVFMLPRELTPESQKYDTEISIELKQFFNTGLAKPVELNKKLNPKEKCVIVFGVLTNSNLKDPFEIALLSKGHTFNFFSHNNKIQKEIAKNSPSTLSLGLDFFSSDSTCYSVLPCGQILF